jgi:hypothetical protein
MRSLVAAGSTERWRRPIAGAGVGTSALQQDFFGDDGSMARLRGIIKPAVMCEVLEHVKAVQGTMRARYEGMFEAIAALDEPENMELPEGMSAMERFERLKDGKAALRDVAVMCSACAVFGWDSKIAMKDELKLLCDQPSFGMKERKDNFSRVWNAYLKRLGDTSKWFADIPASKGDGPKKQRRLPQEDQQAAELLCTEAIDLDSEMQLEMLSSVQLQ